MSSCEPSLSEESGDPAGDLGGRARLDGRTAVEIRLEIGGASDSTLENTAEESVAGGLGTADGVEEVTGEERPPEDVSGELSGVTVRGGRSVKLSISLSSMS